MPGIRLSRVLPLVLLAVAAAGAAWWFYRHQTGGDGSTLRLYGNIDIREVDLTFNNSEHIATLLVQEGDRVKKGQLLATLHRDRLEASVNSADASVAARKAVLARLEAGSRPEEIRQARAEVRAADAKVVDAQTTYTRTVKLVAGKAASEQAVDDAKANLKAAREALKVSEEALALALAGPRIEEIDEARAALKAEEAKLALAREVLKDTELYAPADGIIRNRLLEVGDMATPQKAVFTMALAQPVWVRAYLPEPMLGRVAPGMPASVSTDSYPGKVYHGWIGYISPTAEFTPKNVETPDLRTRLVYQVRVYVCNANAELRLGMPATVSIDISRPPSDQPLHSLDCPG